MKHHTVSQRRRHLIIAGLAAVATPSALFAGQALEAPAAGELLAAWAVGDKLVVSGRLCATPDGSPMADATIETWHRDAYGDRVRVTTDADGRFMFMTSAPAGRRDPVRCRVSRNGQVLATRDLHEQLAQAQRDESGVWRAAFGLTLA